MADALCRTFRLFGATLITTIFTACPPAGSNSVGGHIAFVRKDRAGFNQIWTMDPDGDRLVQITTTPTHHGSPAWSPDGMRLAYEKLHTAGDGSKNYEIFIWDPGKKGDENISRATADDVHPTWSPDGKEIAFSSNRGGTGHSEIWVMRLDPLAERRITETPRGWECSAPSWAPRGDTILLQVSQDGKPNQIAEIGARGKGVPRFLTKPEVYHNQAPEHSNDGQFIVFTSTRSGKHQLYLMDADGKNERPFCGHETGFNDTNASWRPGIAEVCFVSDQNGKPAIWRMQINGIGRVMVNQMPNDDGYPGWR